MLSASNVMAQGEPCTADFDCNGSVDADDITTFLSQFGRSQYNDPCPDCYDSPCPCTTCPYGMIDCGDKCVDPMTDEEYCGVDEECIGGTACGAGELCSAGVCDVPGLTCDGTLSALGRWCDQGDGTVKDMTTGLVWLQDASCMGQMNWNAAIEQPITNLRNGDCGLTDGSVWGDWRLPSLNELAVIAAGDERIRQHGQMYFFTGVYCCWHWSSTRYAGGPSQSWFYHIEWHGTGVGNWYNYAYHVWPVRSDN